eukprot:5955632-Karenia_brevis.AAC.1
MVMVMMMLIKMLMCMMMMMMMVMCTGLTGGMPLYVVCLVGLPGTTGRAALDFQVIIIMMLSS